MKFAIFSYLRNKQCFLCVGIVDDNEAAIRMRKLGDSRWFGEEVVSASHEMCKTDFNHLFFSIC